MPADDAEASADELAAYEARRAAWRTDPILYARRRLGLNPTAQQADLLAAIAPEGAKVSVRAGHGVGKSSAVAAAVWWALECFDFAKIPCTAPTASQLSNVLWAELSKWRRRSDELALAEHLARPLWLSSQVKVTADRIAHRAAPGEWYAVARTARPENPDALQGFHASDLTVTEDGRAIRRSETGGSILFVIEEASGVADAVFEVAEGALSSPGARLLMVGNPTRTTGFFARSHHQDRAMYRALHFACAGSPLVDASYRANLARKYGEGSNVVRVRADGEFPRQDDDVLIALELAEAALSREPGPAKGPRILGVDPARFGDDRTAFVLRQGARVEHIAVRSRQDTMVTAGEAVALRQRLQADTIHVDAIGVGAGVVDRLRELGEPVTGVNVAATAPERRFGGVEAQGKILRDYLWLEMAEWFAKDEPSFAGAERDHAEDLAGEAASLRYAFDSSGRITLESKGRMKRRGLRSPDLADALALTFAPSASDVWAKLVE
jgi:hypothetical protein